MVCRQPEFARHFPWAKNDWPWRENAEKKKDHHFHQEKERFPWKKNLWAGKENHFPWERNSRLAWKNHCFNLENGFSWMKSHVSWNFNGRPRFKRHKTNFSQVCSASDVNFLPDHWYEMGHAFKTGPFPRMNS